MKSHAQQTKDYKETKKADRKPFNWTPVKKFLQKYIGLVALGALAIDGVRLRADDESYMLFVGFGFVLAMLYMVFDGSRK